MQTTEALGPRIRRQRRRLGLTLDELSGKTSISKPYLSLIETGRVSNPPSDEKLRRLEQSLGFITGELLTQAHLQRTPTDVRAMLDKLMSDKPKPAAWAPAAPRNRAGGGDAGAGAGAGAGATSRQADPPAMIAPSAVPVINKASAGYPADFYDLAYPSRIAQEYISCPDVADSQAFGARVHGDAMTPKYLQGDIVIFSPALSCGEGDDCFIRFNTGQTTFKRVFFESDDAGRPLLRLQPRNERHRPQTVAAEQAAGLYKAVYRYQRVDVD